MGVQRSGTYLAVLLALGTMGGCATYGSLGCKDGARVYGGTRVDAALIAEGLAPSPEVAKAKAVEQPVLVWAACCGLVDMPFSFVADTALLPITVSLAARENETDSQTAEPASKKDTALVPAGSRAK
jgi:uncharacterized protein YceK